MKNRRYTQSSVNNFIHCGDQYLFMRRGLHKKIDPGKLNTVGGHVEIGENFLDAVIRETKEETGLTIKPTQIKLTGVIKLEGGYEDDWVMCFFKTEVTSTKLSVDLQTEEGELLWIPKDKVLTGNYNPVDDLELYFEDIVKGKSIIFATLQFTKELKVISHKISELKH